MGVSQKAMDVFKQLDFEGDGVVAYDDFKSGNWLTYNDFGFVWISENVGRKEMLYLTTHSTHFIYGYISSDIW